MRSLYQSGLPGGCIQVAASSDWVKEIVTMGGVTTKTAQRDITKEKAQIANQIIWTFVLAELLERHDARRYRNNIVRGLEDELGKMKKKSLEDVLKFLHDVEAELLPEKRESSNQGDKDKIQKLSQLKRLC